MLTKQNTPQRLEINERYSNLELLRIIAMLFVIIVHYNNKADGKAFFYTEAMPLHYQILLCFEMLAICSVNIFVMISGYFLCTSSQVRITKIIRLYIDVVFFSVFRYVLYCILGDTTFTLIDFLRRFIPLSWYVAVYSGLYLISPYLNQILLNRSRSQFHLLLLVFFFVLSIWPSGIELLSKFGGFSPNSLNPISSHGSGDGYTLVNFILLYFFGAYFRLHENQNKSFKQVIYALLVYIGCVALNTVYANIFFGRATSYCNPLVIIQTISIFVAFQNISIRSKLINNIAKCSFGVYLMHSFFFQYIHIEHQVTGNPFLIPIYVTISAMLIYAASALIYWVYQKICSPAFELIQRKLSFLSYNVN